MALKKAHTLLNKTISSVLMLKKYIFINIASFYLIIYILFNPLQLKAEIPDINPWFSKAIRLKTYQQSYDWRIPWEKGGITTQTGMGLVISLPQSTKRLSSEKIQKTKLLNKRHLQLKQ